MCPLQSFYWIIPGSNSFADNMQRNGFINIYNRVIRVLILVYAVRKIFIEWRKETMFCLIY